MPEGHVIHRLARILNEEFAGEPVAVSSPQGAFATQAVILDGCVLEQAEAWGKHLFVEFDAPSLERIVHIHLGLIGIFPVQPVGEAVAGQVRLQLENERAIAHLHGPQWCRLISAEERELAVAKLGADPLRGDEAENVGKLADLDAKVARSRRSIGSLLMDQKLYAGVGNIYRAEVLFLQGIHPSTRGVDTTQAQRHRIWEELRALMGRGEEAGRIDTVRDEHTPEAMGRAPRKDDHGGEVYVYRRAGEPCLVCSTPIRSELVEGRNLFWCPTCQAG
ncbi:MAG TPA: Fpg/Nei family DNA glycosylase [Candidatus Corynebacterium gallistercoris]|uniref:DNA-(apurinic or apyrimidinic site) lyase n=1 Tax=Candidatus Corynebacterium gallistercoris TaxID=2838530 RepID=A0A9D1UQM8_9CORY|nr:Fpg/Nei family DNA glycosylase [Candidatus Corynebacterium gallistercoris]